VFARNHPFSSSVSLYLHSPAHTVKSLKAISLIEATLEERGFEDDRRFMLVIPAPLPAWGHFRPDIDPTHRFLTQRQCPSLARISAKIGAVVDTDTHAHHNRLIMSCDLVSNEICSVPLTSSIRKSDNETLYLASLWDDLVTVRDMGDEIARYVTRIAQLDSDFCDTLWDQSWGPAGVRLVQQTVRLDTLDRKSDDRYVPAAARSLKGDTPSVSLSDGFPILLANQASLDDLNQRLKEKGESEIDMSQFRPNIVVKGSPAYDEDTWKTISVDGVILHLVKGCPRCKQSCTNQTTGVVSDEPVETLSAYRACQPKVPANVYFAQNALPDPESIGKTIRVGDRIEVIERGEPEWGE
jgi:uncharacterized protein